MARPQEKQDFPNTTPTIREHEQEGGDIDDNDYADTSSAAGCGCFRLFRFNLSRSNGVDDNWHLLNQEGDHHQHQKVTWLEDKLRDAREFSEVVAGPKWKNFIRKLGKLFNKKKGNKNQFQYDPYSYALNFDDGGEEDEYLINNGYSSRFAAPFSGDQERRSVL